eukprot:11012712-Alexandrium_andersonii.AAC.1
MKLKSDRMKLNEHSHPMRAWMADTLGSGARVAPPPPRALMKLITWPGRRQSWGLLAPARA